MQFEESKSWEKAGEKAGFVVAYFVFTTVLFFILILLEKLPSSWSYMHIMLITFCITLFGLLIQRFLK